jgi:hypothetical protein
MIDFSTLRYALAIAGVILISYVLPFLHPDDINGEQLAEWHSFVLYRFAPFLVVFLIVVVILPSKKDNNNDQEENK